MKYFFIVGRNPDLSKLEIFSYLQARKVNFKQVFFKESFLVLDIDGNTELNIQEFGGILKLGKIDFEGSNKDFQDFLDKYIVSEEKFNFSVVGNDTDSIEEMLYLKFKSEKLKVQVRHSMKRIKLQKGEEIALPNSDLQFFHFRIKEATYFGLVSQEYSFLEIKERDMKKPVRRESLAISPRLAKILINLSQVKNGEFLLDPFCGVGGIIQEALIKDINCYGVDKDREAIESAKENIKWLNKKYNFKSSYKFINADSRNLPNFQIDGVATEPSLGETFRKKPNDSEAKKLIVEFENLIVPILKRIKEVKSQKAKIAITFPSVRGFSVDINKVCRLSSLRVCKFESINLPIKEFREEQFVSREIFVLE